MKKYLAHIKKERSSRWSFYFVLSWLMLAIASDFIANEKPLFVQYDDRIEFPVFKSYVYSLKSEPYHFSLDNLTQATKVIKPLIPYSYFSIDKSNVNYVGPFDKQDIASWRYRHWLGTDKIGRDVLAGLINGSRIAAIVGVMVALIAGGLGIFLGLLAGYFGNRSVKINTPSFVLICLALPIAFYILYYQMVHWKILQKASAWIFLSMGLIILLVLIGYKFLSRLRSHRPRHNLWMDLVVMKLIELIRILPNILILLAFLPLFQNPSITNVFILLGLISWPAIALLVRGEVKRIRGLPYIDSSRMLGSSHWHIISNEILPNTLSPFWVAIAFTISGAIIAESTISFLGIGIALEQVSWGTMLSESRMYIRAWWLALFPGILLFLTILSLNRIGDRLRSMGS